MIEEIANSSPAPLVKLSYGKSLSGKFIGTFPVDWPLSNENYRQAALQVETQSVLVTLPKSVLEKIPIGKTIILEGSKRGLVQMTTINPTNKLKL